MSANRKNPRDRHIQNNDRRKPTVGYFLRKDIDSAIHAGFSHCIRFSGQGKSGISFFWNKKTPDGCSMTRILFFLLGTSLLFIGASAAEEIGWKADYRQAVQSAKESSKNLLIYFYAEVDSPKLLNLSEERFFVQSNGKEIRQVAYNNLPSTQQPLGIAAACREFEDGPLADAEVAEKLNDFVLLKLPIDATTMVDGEERPLLEEPMFAEMQNLPGLAILDFQHTDEPYYEDIVSAIPFLRATPITKEQMLTLLDLPTGTLTQRTLIYAVRIHPEKPLSTMGELHPAIVEEATQHSTYQAKTGVLGHQNFNARASRIGQALGIDGASEVCAQSWPNEGLLEGAIGCVRAWRSSSGHWRAVRAQHNFYGYDMVRGHNNAWYATGLFVQ